MQLMNIRIKQNAKQTLHFRLLLLCFYNDNLYNGWFLNLHQSFHLWKNSFQLMWPRHRFAKLLDNHLIQWSKFLENNQIHFWILAWSFVLANYLAMDIKQKCEPIQWNPIRDLKYSLQVRTLTTDASDTEEKVERRQYQCFLISLPMAYCSPPVSILPNIFAFLM